MSRRLGLARRLAAGLAPAQVARATGCPQALLDQLLAEESFLEIVAGWRELLALDPDARTARLTKLAQLVLEEALERRALPAALFTLAHALRGGDPVRAVSGGLERAVERARAEAAPADPLPAAPPVTPGASAAVAQPRRDPLATLCHRTGASLRAAIVVEQGCAALDRPLPPSPGDDPLGAAVHALHRAADAAAAKAPASAGRAPAPPAAAPAPDRPRPSPALVDALADQLLVKLGQAGPAGRLALERLDDFALDHLARELLAAPPRAGPAQPLGP